MSRGASENRCFDRFPIFGVRRIHRGKEVTSVNLPGFFPAVSLLEKEADRRRDGRLPR